MSREAEREKEVLAWIGENFEPGAVKIEDFPLFPNGKKITDQNGGEMVAYFDLLTDKVKWVFPDKDKLQKM